MIVECPKSNDVLFRQGTTIYAHPGNVRFRSLVEQKVFNHPRHQNQDQDYWGHCLTPPPTIVALIASIVDEILIKNKGRVLVWDGCWRPLTNRPEIHCKIEYIVREHIRGMRKTENQIQNKQNIDSNTSIFRSSKNSLCCDTSTSTFTPPTQRATAVTDDDNDNRDKVPTNALNPHQHDITTKVFAANPYQVASKNAMETHVNMSMA